RSRHQTLLVENHRIADARGADEITGSGFCVSGVYPYHANGIAFVSTRKALDDRSLHPTRGTPTRPEVEQHHLTSHAAPGHAVTIFTLRNQPQGEVRRQIAHELRAHGVEMRQHRITKNG